MSYLITTLCLGNKYQPIKEHWIKRVKDKCKNCEIKIIDDTVILTNQYSYDYHENIWAIRFKKNLEFLIKTNKPIVMCDVDVIIEKDIQPIVDLPFDIIISKEIGGPESYPRECSQVIGFGVCCGFMIVKPTAQKIMMEIFKNIASKKYGLCDDQVNIMNYIVNSKYEIKDEKCVLEGVEYNNKIIEIDGIKICVLDFRIVTRDPVLSETQFANHINIDNVGGTMNFLYYFYHPLEKLPLTCRCGKTHLGDYTVCKHIGMRNQIFST